MNEVEKKKNEDISIDGETFFYIKDRLIGGKVFVNKDKSEYLRTASSAEITSEVSLTKDLCGRGFPVPEVLTFGALENGAAYYIEKSIGNRVFGDIFMEETKAQGAVSNESFDVFIEIVKKYCVAQFNPKNFVPKNKEALADMVGLANVMRNNPPSIEMQTMFTEAYEKAAERVMSLPWGYVQADLNAFNILHDGIIDFELSGFGPVGYDVFTNVYFGRMWPKEKVAYRFTDEQIGKYLSAIDTIARDCSLPLISSYTNDFLVLKAIWSSGKDKRSEGAPISNPDFWQWRVRARDWCFKQYLKGEKINSNYFEAAGTGAL